MTFRPWLLLCLAAPALHAQVSLTSAVDLALRHSPRVKMAEADVQKTRAALAETKDVFIPAFSISGGYGQSVGYSPNPPTLFSINGASLVYSGSQVPYIHSARLGFNAARQLFMDTREAVAEDVAITYSDLLKDQQREDTLQQEMDETAKLVGILQDRVDAGRDPRIDLTQARMNAANLRVSRLRAADDTLDDRKHLADLIGEPSGIIRVSGGFPDTALPAATLQPEAGYANAAVNAAFLTAQAKQQQAIGDSKYLYRPMVQSFVQYNRYATFTDSFKELAIFDTNNQRVHIGPTQYAFGVQITLQLYDRGRRDKNRESIMDASHALHEAEQAQVTAADGQSRLRQSLDLLEAQAEAAKLAQQFAQEQLELIELQLNAPVAGTPVLTPKEVQNARIAERERYLTVIDANYQLRKSQISLMRQTGRLMEWLNSSGLITPPQPPVPTLRHP